MTQGDTVATLCHAKKTIMSRIPTKTEVLRVRVEPRFKQDVRQIAILKELDDSDIVRIAVKDYIQRVRNAASVQL